MTIRHEKHPSFQPETTHAARRLDRRDLAAAIARAADFLTPPERALAKAYFEDGRSPGEIARLARVQPRSIYRRISRLAKRITSPRFHFVIHHRAAFRQPRARIATACFLNGLSQRDAARELKIPAHIVRDHVLAVNAMFDRLAR